nr:hypothetical protein CFP56_46716 [Quercus suber]
MLNCSAVATIASIVSSHAIAPKRVYNAGLAFLHGQAGGEVISIGQRQPMQALTTRQLPPIGTSPLIRNMPHFTNCIRETEFHVKFIMAAWLAGSRVQPHIDSAFWFSLTCRELQPSEIVD